MGWRTLNTMRKNERKWSNISVKKYHHRPTLGVRSGRANLRRFVSTLLRKERMIRTTFPMFVVSTSSYLLQVWTRL